jgi:hypothetical protein
LFFIFAYFCSGKTWKHYEEINWLRNKRGVKELTAIAKTQARKTETWGRKGSLTARGSSNSMAGSVFS